MLRVNSRERDPILFGMDGGVDASVDEFCARHRIQERIIALNDFKNDADADAYGVEEFCKRHRISTQLFYKLKPLGLMPVTFKVGTRTLISREAAATWRREQERATRTLN